MNCVSRSVKSRLEARAGADVASAAAVCRGAWLSLPPQPAIISSNARSAVRTRRIVPRITLRIRAAARRGKGVTRTGAPRGRAPARPRVPPPSRSAGAAAARRKGGALRGDGAAARVQDGLLLGGRRGYRRATGRVEVPQAVHDVVGEGVVARELLEMLDCGVQDPLARLRVCLRLRPARADSQPVDQRPGRPGMTSVA